MEKQSYISPQSGQLDITVVRDANPYIALSLDLGIPNFTVFTLKLPLVEEAGMSTIVAEALHVLLDEVSAFMISMEYPEDVIIHMYALVLACFKGMTKESDTDATHSAISEDAFVKTYEGTFELPAIFVNTTQEKVVTAATFIQRAPKVRHLELVTIKPDKNTLADAERVVRMYKYRSLRQQPKPLYVVVYDQRGRPTGTLPLDNQFKNRLLKKYYGSGIESKTGG